MINILNKGNVIKKMKVKDLREIIFEIIISE